MPSESEPESNPARIAWPAPFWVAFLILFGLYLSTRGYRAFEGDQAYRLPLLLQRQDPALFADDPFVQSFDAFNPHVGYLALLDGASRPLGLAFGMAVLYALTFAVTCLGLQRLARSTWPEAGRWVGFVALGLVLVAKAGNIGTNHLFGGMLLDRLIGFGLGWLAIAAAVGSWGAWWVGPLLLGLAGLVHPSVGLQLAMLLGASWVVWACWPGRTGIRRNEALRAVVGLGLALAPTVFVQAGQGGRLFEGLPIEEFRLLTFHVQSPQHMIPSLWRTPQWLAWGCYVLLAGLTLASAGRPWPGPRVRTALVLVVNLIGLGLAWVAVEVLQDTRATLFQPFRMATIARGLALVFVAQRVLAHWNRRDWEGYTRASILVVGLSGDWLLVVATAVEVAWSVGAGLGRFSGDPDSLPVGVAQRQEVSGKRAGSLLWFVDQGGIRAGRGLPLAVLLYGLWFLWRHDTASGHWPLLGGLGVAAIVAGITKVRKPRWTPRKVRWTVAMAWAVPVGALFVQVFAVPTSGPIGTLAETLIQRCRFRAVPTDDVERLAVWSRDHTPESARFIGPPEPKTFRLWSRRSLAFNRAGSPYHAEGLADWAERFQRHVGFEGSTADFAQAYLDDRQALERGYQQMADAQRAELARSQGADHVLAAAPGEEFDPRGPLELLRVEGRYAVYRVREVEMAGDGPEDRQKSMR